LDCNNLNVIGFPFTRIGRGIVSLNLFRALKEAGCHPKIVDISSKSNNKDVDIENELKPYLQEFPTGKINIFVINGDQIKSTERIIGSFPENSYNIIYPAWELGDYPEDWLKNFSLFNEIWVPSNFIKDSIDHKTRKPLYLIPHPVNTRMPFYLNRNYFGIKNTSYTFLFFFDFRSYIERKNPFGMLKAFEILCEENPYMDIQAIIKVIGGERSSKAGSDYLNFLDQIKKNVFNDRIHLINKQLSEIEIRNLIRCTDCFVSLHRSEGFGLGLAEAMCLGKPVIGTGYSGNLQFMNSDNSFLVNYELVPVQNGQYPYSDNQFWANPDVYHASLLMENLIKEPKIGEDIGMKAKLSIDHEISYLSIGLAMKKRIVEIMETSN